MTTRFSEMDSDGSFSLENDILVVGEAAKGDDVIKVVERTKPDILLLDLKMPKGDVVQNCWKSALNTGQHG